MLLLNRKQTLTTLMISLSLGLSLFSSASNSRSFRHYEKPGNPNDYNVELVGSFSRFDSEDSTVTVDISAVSAEIYFDDIDTRGKPLAHAAFLNKKTSLSLFYSKADIDVETVGSVDNSEDSSKGIGLNYISPEDNYILGFTYASGDTSDNQGTNVADSNTKGINIGKYINDNSTIELSYLKQTTDSIGNTFFASEKSTVDIATLSYETLINLGSERFIYFSGSASQIEQEEPGFKATNQEYDLTSEVFFSKKASLSASVGINRGDDLFLEGHTLSAGGTYFITTEFAVNAMGSLFTPDYEFSQDVASVSISGILRF